MSNKPADPDFINDFERITYVAAGRRRGNRRCTHIAFPLGLFDKIQAEAIKRNWAFSRMVRHLCEASIDGIP